ncbi:hypothetical protein P389DRAFT_197804 [Cystobasidium minutum MCA 4210]|uniref:uncharacterized protein n=1 Tax=Cystobasidium minutum MCA 4210 TaxID=1397322 RepID=UPI0034CF449F|eukprot:jgi/Rhomi1/197804/gm1.6018_g
MPRNGTNYGQVLPAYDTKHFKILHYDLTLPGTVPKQDLHLELTQDDAVGSTTGTTLWLGGQVLAAYLLSIKKSTKNGLKPKAIDLGSGIGYTSILLAASGYDTVATDIPILTEGILSRNIQANKKQLAYIPSSGSIECHALDWMTSPEDWPVPLREESFDLIFSSDSIYQAALVQPLLRTIHALCLQSCAPAPCSTSNTPLQAPSSPARSPDIYIAYEHRDDAQYTSFTSQAEEMGFKIKIVPKGKIAKAVGNLYGWKAEVYEGITVLQMRLAQT